MPMFQDLIGTRNSANYTLFTRNSETKVAEDIVHEMRVIRYHMLPYTLVIII